MVQFLILILSASSIWLVTREEEWRKWGYIVGLTAQPFWAYASYTTAQWGMLALTAFYFYSWSQGIYNHFIKSNLNSKNEKKTQS